MKICPETRRRIADEFRCYSGARKDFARRYGETFDVSAQTIYRILSERGAGAGRKKRKQESAVTDEVARKVNQLLVGSKRRNGMVMMPTGVAVKILKENNVITDGFSTATYNRRLRDLGLTAKDIKRPKAYRPIYTEHPNEVWQVDATPCLLYQIDGGKIKSRKDFFMLEVSRKPEDWAKVRGHFIRYIAVDHCSGATYFRYFYNSGETSTDVINFLYEAMAPKADKRYPFRGVPFHLWTDPGSAFKNGTIQNLCDGLDIQLTAHMPGNPQAKGSAESGNNGLTNKFESGLYLEQPESLEQLNEWAFDFCVAQNFKNEFRGDKSRTQLWMYITEEELRECPSKEIFGRCASTPAQRRLIKPNLMVSLNGVEYRLPNDPNLNGKEAFVRFNAYDGRTAEVIVDKGKENEKRFMVEPIAKDKFGRVIDPATAQRPGEPKAIRDSAQEKAAKAGEKWLGEHGVTFKGTGHSRRAFPPAAGSENGLKVFGHDREKLPDINLITKTGTEMEISKDAPEPIYKQVDAMEKISNTLGRNLYRAEYNHIKKTYPQGLTAIDIKNVIELFTEQDESENVVEFNTG